MTLKPQKMHGEECWSILGSILIEARREVISGNESGDEMAIQTCPNCGTKNRVDESAANTRQAICGKCGANLSADANGKPQVVTDATFAQEVVAASAGRPVLVDAWAEWCGPCRMIAPVLDQLAAESNGRYKIAKLNVDENPRTSQQFGIRSIPTMLIFKDGKLVDQLVGALPKQAIVAKLQAQL
jgi:thioredoxin 2